MLHTKQILQYLTTAKKKSTLTANLNFTFVSIWYCWWRWWCSLRWTSSRCWRWWRRRRSTRWRWRPEFVGGRPEKAGDPDIWNLYWILKRMCINQFDFKDLRWRWWCDSDEPQSRAWINKNAKKENLYAFLYLYSRRVAFSSRQAVVTFQTLVWPESNNFVIQDKNNFVIQDQIKHHKSAKLL